MCLAIPARVERVLENNIAMVDVGGVQKEVSLALVEDVEVGDYVILHVGYALHKLDPDEAQRTLELFAQIEAAGAAAETPAEAGDGSNEVH